ncbi:MAG: transglutaminase-like domain-containing protein [Candidatus Hydrogenedentes bacterium]|nr:transglutaminase-like domain-containing protein [Candidatus Hydrogenedentota bacterium]
MNRVMIAAAFLLLPRLALAQPIDMSTLTGEDWYGLYLNGQKSGYLMSAVAVEADGTITVEEDARFKLMMQAVRQDLQTYSKRTYAADGALLRFVQEIKDITGKSRFEGAIEGDQLKMVSTIGGTRKEESIPAPKENLRDAFKQSMLANPTAKIGDKITYSYFEPLLSAETGGRCEIVAEESRTLEGVPTKVFKIATHDDFTGLDTVSYVTEHGVLLEDIVASMITMRLESKEMAQDVNYVNDVLVSNAAYVNAPIQQARTRDMLRLVVKGPLTSAHLFNDERQFFTQKGDSFEFTGRAISLNGFTPAQLPIVEPSVEEWQKPTRFVQSDDPKIAAKAKQIIGDETDTMKITEKLSSWVYENVQTTFSARLTNALEVMNSLEGDCTEHSVLFIALARAAGLPAREVAGLIYMEGDRPGFYFHQWAKVWVGKWIDVDPTWNQPLADVTHIKLGEGDLFQQAQLIPIIGRIQVEVVEDAAAN